MPTFNMRRARQNRPRHASAVAALTVLVCLALPSDLPAKVLMTQQEALAVAFAGEVEPKRQTAFLTDAQAAEAEKASGETLRSRVVTYYAGTQATAYFDTHLVRTLPETIMVVVTGEGTIGRIDVLSFGEPEEYLPKPQWIDQLDGKALDEDLSLRRGIRPITGATLSARAIVAASRRVLAIHRVLAAAASAAPAAP